MLISVLGFSGLGRVAGLPADDQAALLRTAGDSASEHIMLLTPQHGVHDAREQAHVLVAANRGARVCVLPLPHHALTLALVADEVLRTPAAHGGDPTAVWQLVRQSAARSRSLVWHPRLGGPSDLLRSRGWFTELGPAGGTVTPGRRGLRSLPGASVLTQGEAPRLLRTQLGEVRPVPVMVDVAPAPYHGRHAVEVTVLVLPQLPAVPLRPCGDCGAGLVEGQCPFCGHGPAGELVGLGAAASTTHPKSTPPTVRDEVA